jgi:hypothetical protein
MIDRSEFPTRIRPLSEQGAEDDVRGLTMAERLRMMWQLAADVWAFKEGCAVESRLPRHVVRIKRRVH